MTATMPRESSDPPAGNGVVLMPAASPYSASSSMTRPALPSTLTRRPFSSAESTPRTDMTAGKPISRAVTAPWTAARCPVITATAR